MHSVPSHRRWAGLGRPVPACVIATTLLVGGCEEQPLKLLEPAPADSATTLIGKLAEAYEQRDLHLFESLLANDTAANQRFRFVFPENPREVGPFSWDYEEEIRIHQRMFRPQEIPGTGRPIGREWWPERITVQWMPASPFEELEDYYSEDGGPDGKLDRSRWRVTGAQYWTFAVFELEGDTDYVIDEKAWFVVLEDRSKNAGDAGKFRILLWEEIPPESTREKTPWTQSVHVAGWSLVKRLYL